MSSFPQDQTYEEQKATQAQKKKKEKDTADSYTENLHSHWV